MAYADWLTDEEIAQQEAIKADLRWLHDQRVITKRYYAAMADEENRKMIPADLYQKCAREYYAALEAHDD